MEGLRTKEEILKDFPLSGDGKYTYTLKESIEHGTERIEKFILLAPKAKHIRKMKNNDQRVDEVLKVVGMLAGQPDSVIDELCLTDTNKLIEFFSVFE